MNDKIWLSSPHMGGNERKFVTEAFDTDLSFGLISF
jgi:hypothetical protein